MKYLLRHPLPVLKAAFTFWQKDKSAMWSAALAYYTVFSLSPLLIIIISIVGLVFGHQAAQGQIFSELQGLIGEQGASIIQTMVQNANKPAAGIVATVIGIIALLLGASGLFGQLKEALNAIWQVRKTPKGGIIGFIRERFLTFSMVAVIGFLLLVSLVASSVIAGLGVYLHGILPVPEFVLEAINFVISLGVVTILFALVFKLLPDVHVPWSPVIIGSVVTAVLFTIGKTLIGIYLGRGSLSSTFGAAASLAILLVWTYYAAQILFFGCEAVKALVLKQQLPIAPKANAVFTASLYPGDEHRKKGLTNEMLGYIAAGAAVEIGERILKRRKKHKSS